MSAMNLKSDLTYVNILCDSILRRFLKYDTIDEENIKVNLKSYISYVDTSCNSIIRRFLNYDTILAAYIKLLIKSNKIDTS